MATNMLGVVSEVITGLMDNLSKLFAGVGNLFYDTTLETPALTTVGMLAMFALGIGLVFWGVKFVKGLIPTRK